MLSINVPDPLDELDELLSRPTDALVQTLRKLPGDILLLGVGGKMGPTLARMARRASDAAGIERHIIGVSRFSNDALRERLEDWGVETLRCDLLDERAIDALPEPPYVLAMTGFKFGSSEMPYQTWATNCYMPALISRKFRDSRIVAFSTGNVYGLTKPDSGGSRETDPPQPIGEYAMSALGRERIYEYFSRKLDIPLILLRLNYAVEMRYGVLVDLARQVMSEQPIDISMGYVNVIWQADACAMALQALSLATVPPAVLNLAGPEILRIRDVCQQFAELLNKPVHFTGTEAADALLSNGGRARELFGPPRVTAEMLIRWTADWLRSDGPTLDKPTHFHARDGIF